MSNLGVEVFVHNVPSSYRGPRPRLKRNTLRNPYRSPRCVLPPSTADVPQAGCCAPPPHPPSNVDIPTPAGCMRSLSQCPPGGGRSTPTPLSEMPPGSLAGIPVHPGGPPGMPGVPSGYSRASPGFFRGTSGGTPGAVLMQVVPPSLPVGTSGFPPG
jgi:hypothetical protein